MSCTTASGISWAPCSAAWSRWISASYFAPIGQIGMQLELPTQWCRSLKVSVFRACGVDSTFSPMVRAALSTTESRYEVGTLGIGKPFDRGEPWSLALSPATPIAYSALTYQVHGAV